MKIYLLRHGQTAWNKVERWQGNQDTLLDQIGVDQVSQAAQKLATYDGISKVYSSPLQRAARSAEIVGKAIGAQVICRQNLREVHLGEWEGSTTAEVIAKHGELFAKWQNQPAAQIGLGIESLLNLQTRAWQEFCALAKQETADFIIVTHGTWLRCLLCKLLNMPLDQGVNLKVSNAGISVVDCAKDEDSLIFTVVAMDDTAHLS